MTAFTIPFAGELDFGPSIDNYWEFDIDSPLGSIVLGFSLKSGQLAEGLHKTANIFADIQSLDRTAREGIRADYIREPSNSEYFVNYHLEQYSTEELAEFFGTNKDELGLEELLDALSLKAIRFNLGDDDGFAVLDYKFRELENDQILVVYLNSSGVVESVQMES